MEQQRSVVGRRCRLGDLHAVSKGQGLPVWGALLCSLLLRLPPWGLGWHFPPRSLGRKWSWKLISSAVTPACMHVREQHEQNTSFIQIRCMITVHGVKGGDRWKSHLLFGRMCVGTRIRRRDARVDGAPLVSSVGATFFQSIRLSRCIWG